MVESFNFKTINYFGAVNSKLQLGTHLSYKYKRI